jgi:hypothetical protein
LVNALCFPPLPTLRNSSVGIYTHSHGNLQKLTHTKLRGKHMARQYIPRAFQGEICG